jgi:hypothetical protein
VCVKHNADHTTTHHSRCVDVDWGWEGEGEFAPKQYMHMTHNTPSSQCRSCYHQTPHQAMSRCQAMHDARARHRCSAAGQACMRAECETKIHKFFGANTRNMRAHAYNQRTHISTHTQVYKHTHTLNHNDIIAHKPDTVVVVGQHVDVSILVAIAGAVLSHSE